MKTYKTPLEIFQENNKKQDTISVTSSFWEAPRWWSDQYHSTNWKKHWISLKESIIRSKMNIK